MGKGKIVNVKLFFPESVTKRMAECDIQIESLVKEIIEKGTTMTFFSELSQVEVKKVK